MKDNVYLDNAATTWPKPEPVFAFMDRFSRDIGVNAGRGSHALAADADRMVRQARAMIAAFVGFSGPAERVVFASNGTDALNTAINGLVEDGAHVVTSGLEHNAVARVLNHATRDRAVRFSTVSCDSDGYVNPGSIASALQVDTGALVINHGSNVAGTIQDIDAIAKVASAANVPLILDAAQTAGVVPIDMDRRGIAVVAFPGHKGLFGPMGSGGLVMADGIELRAQRFGGTGVDSASEYQPSSLPWRLEPGTLGMPGIAGMHAAQLWFRALGEHLSAGGDPAVWSPDVIDDIDAILDHADSLSREQHAARCLLAIGHVHSVECAHVQRIESMLSGYAGVRVLGSARDGARVATISFVHSRIDAQEIADRLDADHGICVRAGLQCAPWAHRSFGSFDTGGSVRLSPGYFTDEEDLAQLSNALEDVLGAPV